MINALPNCSARERPWGQDADGCRFVQNWDGPLTRQHDGRNQDPAESDSSFHRPMFMRFRLLRSNGNAANQVHWWEHSTVINPTGNVSRPSPANALRSFNLMDQWLSAIEADKSSLPHAKKVTRNKPAAARDTCFVGGVEYQWTAGSICDQLFTYTGLIRITAAAQSPTTSSSVSSPLSRVDYNVVFTDEQWARLQAIAAQVNRGPRIPGQITLDSDDEAGARCDHERNLPYAVHYGADGHRPRDAVLA